MGKGAISSTMEDYLEAILRLVRTKAAARARDIADALGVHRSTVTAALKTLSEHGLIHYAPYEVVTLTDEGVRRAEEILRRHEILRVFFIDLFGVEPEEAEKTACLVEHAVSDEVVDRMRAFRRFVGGCPRAGAGWLAKAYSGCVEDGSACDACVAECARREWHEEAEGLVSVPLASCAAGTRGRFEDLACGPELARRLGEMGVTPGAPLEVVSAMSPEGTMEIRVRGYHLALRAMDVADLHVGIRPGRTEKS